MRDKLIKEKLGISVTNFMPANGANPGKKLRNLFNP